MAVMLFELKSKSHNSSQHLQSHEYFTQGRGNFHVNVGEFLRGRPRTSTKLWEDTTSDEESDNNNILPASHKLCYSTGSQISSGYGTPDNESEDDDIGSIAQVSDIGEDSTFEDDVSDKISSLSVQSSRDSYETPPSTTVEETKYHSIADEISAVGCSSFLEPSFDTESQHCVYFSIGDDTTPNHGECTHTHEFSFTSWADVELPVERTDSLSKNPAEQSHNYTPDIMDSNVTNTNQQSPKLVFCKDVTYKMKNDQRFLPPVSSTPRKRHYIRPTNDEITKFPPSTFAGSPVFTNETFQELAVTNKCSLTDTKSKSNKDMEAVTDFQTEPKSPQRLHSHRSYIQHGCDISMHNNGLIKREDNPFSSYEDAIDMTVHELMKEHGDKPEILGLLQDAKFLDGLKTKSTKSKECYQTWCQERLKLHTLCNIYPSEIAEQGARYVTMEAIAKRINAENGINQNTTSQYRSISSKALLKAENTELKDDIRELKAQKDLLESKVLELKEKKFQLMRERKRTSREIKNRTKKMFNLEDHVAVMRELTAQNVVYEEKTPKDCKESSSCVVM